MTQKNRTSFMNDPLIRQLNFVTFSENVRLRQSLKSHLILNSFLSSLPPFEASRASKNQISVVGGHLVFSGVFQDVFYDFFYCFIDDFFDEILPLPL